MAESSEERSLYRRPITALARELGEELRRERVRAKCTTIGVSEDLQWSAAKLSKLEAGSRGTDEWDTGLLLGQYGTDKMTRERVRKLLQEQDDEWFVRPHQDRLPDELLSLRIHEAKAHRISCYEPLAVPWLAQSEHYARASLAGASCTPDLLDSLVELRLDRQRALLGRPTPPEVDVFVHEAALQLIVGNVAVMQDQLMHLLFLCDLENVVLRVVPFSAESGAALRHPVTLMTFAEPAKTLACVETDAATLFSDHDEAVVTLLAKFGEVRRLALDASASRETVRYWADAFDRG